MGNNEEQYVPEWVKKMEDWGKKQDQKWNKKPKWDRKGEQVGSIVGNLIAIFVVTYAPKIFPNFFTPAYSAVLSVMLSVLFITIIGEAILLAYSPKWFYLIVQSLLQGLSVLSMIVIITIFPFNTPGTLDVLIKFGLTIAAIIVSIVGVVYFVRGVAALFSQE